MVQLLLEALADLRPGPPGQPGPPGALPLLAASTAGHREVVQQLLWARCDSELRDALGKHGAVSSGGGRTGRGGQDAVAHSQRGCGKPGGTNAFVDCCDARLVFNDVLVTEKWSG